MGERRAKRQAEGVAQHLFDEREISLVIFLIILGAIAIAILKLPLAVIGVGAVTLDVATRDLETDLNGIFSSRGLRSDIRL